MTKAFLKILQESGSLFPGHTEFYNGMHGDGWVEKGFIVRHPEILDKVTKMQSKQIRERFPEVNLIVGEPSCGAIVASYVASHLGIELAITKDNEDETGVLFHRMYVPETGRKIVHIEDCIFSGTAVKTHTKFYSENGYELLGVSSWISRPGLFIDGVPIISLYKPLFQMWRKEECPMCKKNEELQYKNIRE